jgi:tetratricopeptide (TPR) repeat protein
MAPSDRGHSHRFARLAQASAWVLGAWVLGAWVLGAWVLGAWAVLAGLPALAQDQKAEAPSAARLGAVGFQISCSGEVQDDFDRGVSLLHSFWYEAAADRFAEVIAADPDCAMGYWGQAMTGFPQINGWPGDAAVAAAERALAAADAASERSAREAAYIHALHRFYDGFTRSAALDQARRYSDAMGALAAAHPEDLEAQVFYALALLASDSRHDVTLDNPRKAYAILAPLFAQHPEHPGIAHYIIHACDNPEMAPLALTAARRYASTAPAVPHALHMPGHIFARLGLWPDDIRSNLASRAAAEHPLGMRMGAENRLHAMEFLEYAYLQTGEDEQARAIVTEAKLVHDSEVDPRYPTYYGIVEARFPVLYAIETRDWDMAEHLEPIAGGNAYSQALILLAHVTAAANRGDRLAADQAVRALDALVQQDPPPPVGSLKGTLPEEIRAWAAVTQGDLDRAVTLLRPVAERQDKVGKGEVELPAREMLADMLLMRGDAGQALTEYQTSLRNDPNRFNGLLGAGQAAERLGQSGVAAGYYRTLLANCTGATGAARKRLAHASRVVESQAARSSSKR